MPVVSTTVGAGGVELGGSADVEFVHGSGQAAADIVVEWDLDGDGDFDDPLEDITAYLMGGESLTGRAFPSLLTGRAGPGQLRIDLLNDDGRFGFFNDASPLNTPPFSVRSGGRIRVRTADAVNVDPVLLARDRFDGSGALGDDELGNTWQAITTPVFVRQADSAGYTLAVHNGPPGWGISTPAMAAVDIDADLFAQLTVRTVDATNSGGIIYRVDDADNYGTVFLQNGVLYLAERVGGVLTAVDQVNVERRRNTTIAVHVDGTDAVGYVEGVPVLSGTAYSSSSGLVGIRGNWQQQRAPAFDRFDVWDRPAAEVEGVLWTGKVVKVTPRTAVDDVATVTLDAEGPLADAARTEVDPPSSIGPTSTSAGCPTGLIVGATLAAATLLHPPGPLSLGDVTPGAFGRPRGKALDIAREAEEVELGFLHETNEGRIGYEARGDRVGGPPDALFSDNPSAQFGYRTLELGDWRREVVNRVTARVAPLIPGVHIRGGQSNSTAAGVANDVAVTLFDDVTHGVEVGDLYLIVVASTVTAPGVDWLTPLGWTAFRDDARDVGGKLRVYAKIAEAADFGATITLFDDTTPVGGSWLAHQHVYKRVYGDVLQGLEVAFHTYGSPLTGAQAASGQNVPPTVFPSWGPAAPSLLLSWRGGMSSTSGAVVETPTDVHCPAGYGNTTGTVELGVTNNFDVALQNAIRDACVAVETPSSWASGYDIFGGFNYTETCTIAVRGFAGDPPETTGGPVVQVDDQAAQDRYESVLTHDNAAELFADEADALAYGEGVLLRYNGDRPVLTMSFPATLTEAHRAQAIRRRVGHRIRLEASGAAGLGISGDFYVESIRHQWSDGGKVWAVSWELSPA